MMELNRIASHLVWLGTTGLELGAISMMLYGFREREYILEIFEMITGLRMNMAYVRPGGVAQDVPPEAITKIREFLVMMPEEAQGVRGAAVRPADLDRAHQGRRRCSTSPAASRSASPARCCARPAWAGTCASTMPYCGYETYEFDVPTATTGDVWGRYEVRMAEMRESLKIIEQCLDRLKPGPDHGGRQEDRLAGAARDRRRRPGQLARARREDHGSVDGVADPPLQAGHRGLPGAARPGLRRRSRARAASSACTRSPTAAPARTGCTSASRASSTCRRSRPWPRAACIADVIAGGASLDPVMGGCDR